MTDNVDDILAQVRSLTEQLDRLGPTDRNRNRLETDREQLRQRAARLADAGRHPRSVALQIEALEARLTVMESESIKKGFSERSTTKKIQDPGAYSHNINSMLREKHAKEHATILQQLKRLRAIDLPTDRTPPQQ